MTRTAPVKLGFREDGVVLQVAAIKSLKTLRATTKESGKYRQIVTSIRAVGLVEPPIVIPDADNVGSYFVLDGHLRLEALRDLGVAEVACLVATDDETFTYNKRINRISVAQEHKMILRAIERGVPEEKLAEALGVDVITIRRRAKLLNGICPEVVDLLKDTATPMVVFDILRMMKPLRQIEAAELMVGQSNFSRNFANAMLVATPESQLATSKRKSPASGASRENMARLERELSALQGQIKSVEDTFGVDTLHLTVAKGYLSRLLAAGRVVRWLAQNRPEYLGEFQSIAEMRTIGNDEMAAE
ncbi:plasmid partitioning protein RepB C-terminal domain-containing protein [Caulobacter sp. CCG-8]|uniref:plasmid partitioning protein RepB C-terminal domain-containing protein n=1 Tax=Caulobacter sp. CCG-8 TaxID=3127958 RepID=UPI00307F9256